MSAPLIDYPQYRRASDALHYLWSRTPPGPGYDKARWMELERAIEALAVVARDAPAASAPTALPVVDTPAWARLPWAEERGWWIARCGETTFRVYPQAGGGFGGYVEVGDELIIEGPDTPEAPLVADEAKAALVDMYRAWLLARLKEIE